MPYSPPTSEELEKHTRKTAFAMRLAQRVAKKHKGLLDRLATIFIAQASKPKSPADDFMRDEIIDADIGFSVEELEAYQRGERGGSKSVGVGG